MDWIVPRSKMPTHLRIVGYVFLLVGLTGIGLQVSAWFGAGSVRWLRLLFGIYLLFIGGWILDGDRDGVGNGLWFCGLGILFTSYFLFVQGRHDAWFWVVWVSAVLCAPSLLWCRTKLPWVQRGSAQHWKSDPDWRQGVQNWVEFKEEMLEQDRSDPPDAKELAARLVDPDDDRELARFRLQALLKRPKHADSAVTAVVAAIESGAWNGDPEELKRLLVCLPSPAPTQVAPGLLAAIPQFEGEKHWNAWCDLAQTVAPVAEQKLLEGLENEEHQHPICCGLARGFKAGRGSAGFRDLVRPKLLGLLDGGYSSESARCLVVIAPDVLVNTLTENIDWENHRRSSAMRHAIEHGLELDPAIARRLLGPARAAKAWLWVSILLPMVDLPTADLESLSEVLFDEPNDYHRNLAAAVVLRELVRRNAPGVEARVRAAIDTNDDGLCERAAEILCVYRGLPEDLHLYSEDPKAKRVPAMLACMAVSTLYNKTLNSGLAGSFELLDHDEVEALLPALETMGCSEALAIVRRLIDAAGGLPLPKDRDERLERIFSVPEELEDALSSEFYDIDHLVEARLYTYAAEHADEIRPFVEST